MWILPTVSRPKNVAELLKQASALDKSEGIVFLNGKEHAEEYINLVAGNLPDGWKIRFNDVNIGMIGALNLLFKEYPNESYYGLLGDDEFVHTKDWNQKLTEAAGQWNISHANEGWQSSQRIHSFTCIGGELARCVGYLAIPACWHWYGVDTMWEAIAQQIPIRRFCGDVITEHRHFLNNKAVKDECYALGESRVNEDGIVWEEWLRNEMHSVIQRIRNARPENNSHFIPKPGNMIQRSSGKAKVSLTMIVRNEEHNLPRCLESVRGLFDEVVLVDTGSTDRTKEIALQFGARVIDFTWIDDFSAARNISLDNATGDYVFWLDADDILSPHERNKLETLLNNLNVEHKQAYVVRCASAQLVVDHVRLFPRLAAIRWAYRVHEQILPSLQQANIPVHWSNVTIEHNGYNDIEIKERKRHRDWNILLKELASMPDDPFVLYNLGMIAFERQQWQEALDYLCRSFANLPASGAVESLRRKLSGMIAWTYQILGNYGESLRISEEGLAVDVEDAELWFRKAVAYRYLRKTVEAEACWRHILCLRRPEKFCSIDQGIYGHLTRRNLALIAEERGDIAEAQIHWRAILAECPADIDATRHIMPEVA